MKCASVVNEEIGLKLQLRNYLRGEAIKLRSMARSLPKGETRQELERWASQAEELAGQITTLLKGRPSTTARVRPNSMPCWSETLGGGV